jgi:GNAT superfamily N-acetyltransferase
VGAQILRFDAFAPTKAERKAFDCGREVLDRWLVERAGQSMKTRDAVTFLLCVERRILGYYCASSASISRAEASARHGRGAPDPIPAVLLGRLAVDRSCQGEGYGAELLRHAINGALAARQLIGARCLLVHALDNEAARFYRRWGFEPTAVSRAILTLYLPDVERTMAQPPPG